MPPRVVSLVPSATEIVCALGASELLVGRSHECDYPPLVAGLPVLTGQAITSTDPAEIDRQVRDQLATASSLYRLDAEMLARLRPDVILTQDLCSVCSIDLDTVRSITQRWSSPPTILSLNPESIEDVLDHVLEVGRAIERPAKATSLVTSLRERMAAAAEFVNPFEDGPHVAFLEWTDPLYVGGHWIPQLIERAGGRHPLNPTTPVPGSGAAVGPQQAQRLAGKSIRVPEDILAAADPDGLIIAPCGVGLAHAWEMAGQLLARPAMAGIKAVRTGRVAVVDGNQMFSRPGPRLVDAFEWLVSWLQERPHLIPVTFPWRALRRWTQTDSG
ncbi:MAG: hypothetical protein GIKADHBN_01403 [Phycisphaerales bacterium]|nr:hypothetical protein [Phycisphaerales bacterium]